MLPLPGLGAAGSRCSLPVPGDSPSPRLQVALTLALHQTCSSGFQLYSAPSNACVSIMASAMQDLKMHNMLEGKTKDSLSMQETGSTIAQGI